MTGKPKSDLNDKQRAFVREYLKDSNGKQAAIRAGYSAKTAEAKASALLRIVKVREALEKAVQSMEERIGLSVERVLKEAMKIAFLDPRALFDERGQLRPIHTLEPDVAAAIGGIDQVEMLAGASIGEDGVKIVDTWCKKIKLNSKIDGLKILADYLRMGGSTSNGNGKQPFSLHIHLHEKPKQLGDGAKVINQSSKLPVIHTSHA